MDIVKIIEKFKTSKFPSEWENIVELIVGNDICMLKNVNPGTSEWQRIEINFKLTMPGSQILKIERI